MNEVVADENGWCAKVAGGEPFPGGMAEELGGHFLLTPGGKAKTAKRKLEAAVFEEVQGIVSTLNFREEEKLPQSWFDRLQQAMLAHRGSGVSPLSQALVRVATTAGSLCGETPQPRCASRV